MTIATSKDQTDIQSSIRAWAKSADPVATTRAQETDAEAWRAHWQHVVDLGLTSVAISEARGGADAEVVDLACMLEETSAALVPGPLLSSTLAGVLVDHSGGAVADAHGEALAAGELQAGVVLAIRGEVLEASGDTVSGDAGIALGGTAGGAVLLPVRRDGETAWLFLAPGTEGLSVEPGTPFDISANSARVRLDSVRMTPDNTLAGLSSALVHHLAVTLAAAELAGIGDYTLRTAVEYAKIREQFGKTIGSFQSIKHLAANMLCRTEEIRALAWDAAVAAGEALQSGDNELDISAATAGALAADLAVRNAQDCIQILGGIGYTFEHEAHFYLRDRKSVV